MSGSLNAIPLVHREPSSTIRIAIQKHDVELVNKWIQHYRSLNKLKEEINEVDANGYAPVHYAAKCNHVDIVRTLKEAGADLNKKSVGKGYTPMHFAALCHYHSEIQTNDTDDQTDETNQGLETDGAVEEDLIKYLIENAAESVRETDSEKSTPLHLACREGNLEVVEDIIKQLKKEQRRTETEVGNKNEIGNTPLHEASLKGDFEIVESLFECIEGDNLVPLLSISNGEGRTPLHLACQGGNYKTVRHILDHLGEEHRRTLINEKDKEGNTPLHLVCKTGGSRKAAKNVMQEETKVFDKGETEYKFKTIAEDLIKYTEKVDVENEHGETPLHVAARHSGYSMITILLQEHHGKAPASVNKYNKISQTPLIIAAYADNQPACLALVLHRETKLGVTDGTGKYAHHIAAELGHVDVLKALQGKVGTELAIKEEEKFKQSKWLLNSTDSEHNTPLHLAAQRGHIECVRALLYDTELRIEGNNDGMTPLHLAAKNNHFLVVSYLLRYQQEFLTDTEGNTPLHLACIEGHFHITQALVKQNETNLKKRNKSLRTPLDEAVLKGHIKIVKFLVKKGAELNPKDLEPQSGETKPKESPLQLAVEGGHLEVVDFLLEKEANVDCGDSDSNPTPLIRAIQKGHESIAMAIVNSKEWCNALTKISKEGSTPFRQLIEKMPLVANRVLDNCSELNDEKTEVEFNFEYVDDFRRETKLRTFFARCSKNCSDACCSCGKCDTTNYNPVRTTLKFKKENHPLYIMVKHDRKNLLEHPLVIALLNLKWKTYGLPFFILSFLLYVPFFLVVITFFALNSPNPQSVTCQAVFANTFGQRSNERLLFFVNITDCVSLPPVNSSNMNTITHMESDLMNGKEVCSSEMARMQCEFSDNDCGICEQSSLQRNCLKVAAGIVLSMACLQMIFEIIQLCVLRIQYISDIVNWIEVPLFISAGIFSFVFSTDCLCPFTWQWQIGSIAVFLAWIDLIIYIRVLPFGIYFLMLENIFTTFWKIISLTFVLVTAFALAFYMTFDVPSPEFARSPFTSPGRSLIKVMTMSSGDLGFDAIFRQFPGGTSEQVDEIPFLQVSCLLWILFLIVMSILFSNLLTGLAIDDIQKIRNDAEVRSLELKINFILSVQALLPCSSYQKSKKTKIRSKRRFLHSSWLEILSFVGITVESHGQLLHPRIKKDVHKEMKQIKDNMQNMRGKMDDNTHEVLEEMNDNKTDMVEKMKDSTQEMMKNISMVKQEMMEEINNSKKKTVLQMNHMQKEVENRMDAMQLVLLNLEHMARDALQPK